MVLLCRPYSKTMKTFNRIIWPALAVLLAVPEVVMAKGGFYGGVATVVLIQVGLGVFIYHDWKKQP